MAWRIDFDRKAERELERLGDDVARRIVRFMRERVAELDDPRSIGEALRGPRFRELWKYRIGDYRVIARIEDAAIRILVVRIGNRRDVYR